MKDFLSDDEGDLQDAVLPELTAAHLFDFRGELFLSESSELDYLDERYRLPHLGELLGEEEEVQLAFAWNKDGLHGQFQCPKGKDRPVLHLFINTRDVKSATITRFCHHFRIHHKGGEEHTRFREDQSRALCDSGGIKVKEILEPQGKFIRFFVSKSCLFGYDPALSQRLGFAYRLELGGGKSQHFTVTSEDYHLEQQPRLWTSMRLVK